MKVKMGGVSCRCCFVTNLLSLVLLLFNHYDSMLLQRQCLVDSYGHVLLDSNAINLNLQYVSPRQLYITAFSKTA